jgi:hypothetical protein
MQLFLSESVLLLKEKDFIEKKILLRSVYSQTCKMAIGKVSNLYR